MSWFEAEFVLDEAGTAFGFPSPGLKNGASAWATPAGVWNRRAGSFAIIVATTPANSAGTSDRTRSSGSAVDCRCAGIYLARVAME